jgi:hexokinase
MKNWSGETPVNLESGNFHPPHLTPMDELVDAQSDNKGYQRFEKAVSGMYLGRVFMAAFPGEKFDENLSAVDLSRMINNPSQYKAEHVEVAYQIYERSAKLVAASLSGLVQSLYTANPKIRKVQVLAEGSLFWSKISTGRPDYDDIVSTNIKLILASLGLPDIDVKIAQMENANLIGAAMAVLS